MRAIKGNIVGLREYLVIVQKGICHHEYFFRINDHVFKEIKPDRSAGVLESLLF